MTISEIPSPSDKLARLRQLERLTYMITLNGAELCALAQLTRKVGGLSDTTYRKYTEPLSNWFERQEFLYYGGGDSYFNEAVVMARNLPE